MPKLNSPQEIGTLSFRQDAEGNLRVMDRLNQSVITLYASTSIPKQIEDDVIADYWTLQALSELHAKLKRVADISSALFLIVVAFGVVLSYQSSVLASMPGLFESMMGLFAFSIAIRSAMVYCKETIQRVHHTILYVHCIEVTP